MMCSTCIAKETKPLIDSVHNIYMLYFSWPARMCMSYHHPFPTHGSPLIYIATRSPSWEKTTTLPTNTLVLIIKVLRDKAVGLRLRARTKLYRLTGRTLVCSASELIWHNSVVKISYKFPILLLVLMIWVILISKRTRYGGWSLNTAFNITWTLRRIHVMKRGRVMSTVYSSL